MSLIYDNQTYPSLQEFVKIGVLEAEKNKERLQFAHQIDGAILKALDSLPVKTAVNKIVELYVSKQSGIMLSTGITVTPFNYPKLYDSLVSCCNTLGISVPQVVVSPSMPGINAMATGTDEFSFIAISDMAQALLPEDQLKFIVGHECGHIALEHVVFHTIGQFIGSLGTLIPGIGPLLANVVSLPLNTWSRYSEISADRAGFLCCGGDLKVAQKALLRLSGGFSNTDEMDVNQYIEQCLQSLEDHKVGAVNEYFMNHPLIPKRLKALELFSRSEMFYRVTNKSYSADDKLLNDNTLNDLVNEAIKVL